MELCVSYGVYITLTLHMPSRALHVVKKSLIHHAAHIVPNFGVDMLFFSTY